jgi:hypothetical protein
MAVHWVGEPWLVCKVRDEPRQASREDRVQKPQESLFALEAVHLRDHVPACVEFHLQESLVPAQCSLSQKEPRACSLSRVTDHSPTDLLLDSGGKEQPLSETHDLPFGPAPASMPCRCSCITTDDSNNKLEHWQSSGSNGDAQRYLSEARIVPLARAVDTIVNTASLQSMPACQDILMLNTRHECAGPCRLHFHIEHLPLAIWLVTIVISRLASTRARPSPVRELTDRSAN